MSALDAFLDYLGSLPKPIVYLFLGLSAFVENVFPPIPGDTITAFGAFLVGVRKLGFVWVYISTTAGSLLGFLTLYWVARQLGRRFFMERNYRFFKAEEIVRAEAWFTRYGYFLILINRFLPGIRSAISVAAGISGLGLLRVCLLACVSGALWNGIWILFGYFVGTNWEVLKSEMARVMGRYNLAVGILMFLAVSIFLIKKFLGGRSKGSANSGRG